MYEISRVTFHSRAPAAAYYQHKESESILVRISTAPFYDILALCNPSGTGAFFIPRISVEVKKAHLPFSVNEEYYIVPIKGVASLGDRVVFVVALSLVGILVSLGGMVSGWRSNG